MYQLKIGLRSLLYRKTQYISLFLVCAVGVGISLASIFMSRGMISSMSEKAKIYYGGDLIFMHGQMKNLFFFDFENYEEKLKSFLPASAIVSSRMDYDARNSSFYFEGSEALQKTIKGVDFNKEKALFEKFNFVSGGIEGIYGSNGIIISQPIAKILNISVGDSMTFMLKTAANETNTVDLIVRGIFQDSSVFGMYTSYMDFSFLKEISGRPANFANRICINFPDHSVSKSEINKYQKILEGIYPMFPLVDDKNDYLDFIDDYDQEAYGLIPLEANLTDVKIMQFAMNAVISFVIIMLTVIIIAGIGSTYRVLIMKRINEIGIYMAIGMKKRSITFTLLFESLVLLLLGCIAGFALSGIICLILSVPDLSFIPSFDLFLENGNLKPSLDVIKMMIVIISVISVTLMAVLYSTCKSIKIMPVKALATTE